MINLFERTEEEILNLIKEQSEIGDDLIVVGRFVNFNNKESFINIRNSNFVPLTYVGQGNEHIGKKLKIEIKEKHSYTLERGWYEFKIKLGDEKLRRYLNNPTLATIDLSFEPKIFQPKEKDFVYKLYNRKANQSLETDRGNIQSLKIIEREINRVKEAFIYELLQNADDYPILNKKVDVKIYTTANSFVFSHNGSPFKFNNVYALCNINDGDKQDDVDKIGYKGIGFKSVFAYSDKVLVKSGKYIFKFDKNHPGFQREKPFQIIPIWVDNLSVLKELPITENVNVVIETKQGNSQIEEWKELLNGIFSQESSTPVILFLRNIRNVFIDRTLVSQTTREWWIREYKLKLSDEIKLEIKRQFETNTGNIPEKLVGVDELEIQFALKHLDYDIIPLPDAILYNYLPTKVNLGFPFLVNSDFIPTGDRHYLFENEWNRYLMKEVGKVYFDWLNTLFTVKHKNTEQPIFKKDYLRLLPDISKNIQELKSKSSNNLFLLEAFKQGFDFALSGDGEIDPIAFIPTQSGSLVTISNILIDETGLADFLKHEFVELTGISAKLIDNEVGEGIEKIKALISEYGQGFVYGIEELKADIKKTVFQEWLKNASNNFKFIQHLNSIEELKSLLKSEEIILSEDKKLCKASALFKEVPKEITFLLTENVNSQLLTILKEKNISLSFKVFEAVKFFVDNILNNHNVINQSLTNETNLINFWKFVFDNWIVFEKEKSIIDSLQRFEVLCKPKKLNELSKSLISNAYLSAEFTLSNEIESVVKEIRPDAQFISEKYISKNVDKEKWRKIFRQAEAITDLQRVLTDLLPKLSNIDEEKHSDIAKQIFKFWKDPATKLNANQINLIKADLKIKCVDKKFRNAEDCFISDHYQTNKIINTILKEVELPNQISSDYSNTQITDWNTFFKIIGCIPLEDKQQVIDGKLAFIVSSQEILKDCHFDILKSIYHLQKTEKDSGFIFDFENSLSQIKLKTDNDEWHLPTNIHLSSSYKPKLNLQQDETEKINIHFLNQKYFSTGIDKIFLMNLGVNDGFKFYVKELNRTEIPISYREEFESRFNYIAQNATGYGNQHRLQNHIELNYKFLLHKLEYSTIFWKELTKSNSKQLKYLANKTTYRTAYNSYSFENFVTNYIKQNTTFPSQMDELKRPSDLYTFLLIDYITDKNELPKFDLSTIYIDNDESISLEEILGLKKKLSQKHCIELLSRTENQITLEQISALLIVDILNGYKPSDEEKEKIFLLNTNLEWKPINELFISLDEQFQIEPTQNLHEDFYSIAESFGIQDLSEENLVVKTNPKTPSVIDEIELFFRTKAKFIAFKIDHLNHQEVEAMIIEKINQIVFYEVTSISKVFPEVKPIYKKEIAFHFEAYENKIFYKDNWKTNSELKLYLHKYILEEKIPEAWFENVVNRWDEKELIELLIGEYGSTPFVTEEENVDNEKILWDEYSEDEATYIKSIVNINYNQEGQLDANTTAKIKTLMIIKGDYGNSPITDEGRYLKAGNNEILVRSAQKGLLYLDLYHWERLNEANVKIAVYTNSQINIFNSQEDLFQYCKPQNKFGVLRMPNDYTLDDYNSLNNITEKGKWHYVFIVNEDAKAAKQYKEIIDLDEYNNYG